MTKWAWIHVGFEGDDFKIKDVEVWKQEWRPVQTEPLELPHPQYRSQMHTYRVYDAGIGSERVRFAASELSNGVWGFYVPVRRG